MSFTCSPLSCMRTPGCAVPLGGMLTGIVQYEIENLAILVDTLCRCAPQRTCTSSSAMRLQRRRAPSLLEHAKKSGTLAETEAERITYGQYNTTSCSAELCKD